MKTGVKFCGGCNSRYSRRAVLEQIQKDCPKDEFSIAKEDESYDIILVIGGCTNCCASYEQYKTNCGIVKIWDINQIEDVLGKLRIAKEKTHELEKTL